MNNEEINPFILNAPIEVMGVNTKAVVPNNVGDSDAIVYEGSSISSSYYVEKQKKVSLYIHPKKDMNEMLWKTLGPKGRDLLLYIITHIQDKQDYITLKTKLVREVTGMSRNSYFAALKELKAAGVIASKSLSVYWINPFHIFRGNRISFYRGVSEGLVNTVTTIQR